MVKIFLIFAFLSSLCFSETIKQIKELQKSLAKDFIIYQTLKDKNISSDEAKELLGQIYRLNPKLEREFHKKIDDKEFSFAYDCKKMEQDEFLKATNECMFLALSPAKIQKLPQNIQLEIYEKLKKTHKQKLTWLKSMLESDVFKSLTKGDGKDFLRVFFGVDEEYRKSLLDRKLPESFLEKLESQKWFEKFVIKITQSSEYENIATSLMYANYANISFKSSFYLGILSLLHEENALALKFFHGAYKRAKKPHLKDRAMFWIYEVSKEREVLRRLSKSKSFNIYALYAKEIFGKSYEIITPKPTKESLQNYSITDPFTWEATKKHIENFSKFELEKFSQKFFTKASLPYYIFMQQRVNGYKNHYFITPYDKYVKDCNDKRKALIYAIARQESRYIPVDVSKSYALGMMQFMPFLARAVAKEVKFKHFIYEDMFKPSVALKFANIHLDYLQTYLFNPLLVAYAYNGGIGFTRRELEKLFKNGPHEPFLSMELIGYEESREYGKKVLANYIIYGKIYGFNTSLREIFQNLKPPAVSYGFVR